MKEFFDILLTIITVLIAILIPILIFCFSRKIQRDPILNALAIGRINLWTKKTGETKHSWVWRIINFYEYLAFLVIKNKVNENDAKELFLTDIISLFKKRKKTISKSKDWKFLMPLYKRWVLHKPQKQSPETHSKISWTLASFFFLIMIVLLLVESNTFNLMLETLKNNIGDLSFNLLKLDISASLLIAILFFGLLFCLNKIFYTKQNLALIFAISLIIFVLFAGFFIINQTIGYQQIKLNLNPLNQGLGVIECSGQGEIMLAGDNITCKTPNFDQYEMIKVNFIFKNHSSDSEFIYAETDTFIAPENLRYIGFELVNENYSEEISTGWPFKFQTLEEYEQNKIFFLTALLSLILLAFATVPSIVLNLKKLILNKE
jgi:hypothetical protein